MAKKEVKTDFWVYELLKDADINLTPQGCDIKDIDEALKTASKSKTGNVGYPEYCGVVEDFIIVIEDKAYTKIHDDQLNRYEDIINNKYDWDDALKGFEKHFWVITFFGYDKTGDYEKDFWSRRYSLKAMGRMQCTGTSSPYIIPGFQFGISLMMRTASLSSDG